MMRFQAGRLAAWLSPVLLLAACGSSGTQRATRQLDDRLQTQLAPAIADGQATLQPLPAGARVTLPPPTGFVNGNADLDDKDRLVLDSVIEGLLDSSLLRIDVADRTAAPDSLQAARARNVTQYFIDYGLGPSLQPADPAQGMPSGAVAAPPPGITITINVACPRRSWQSGYGTGQVQPSCG